MISRLITHLGVSRSASLSIAAVAVVYCITLAALDRDGLWITDNEVKLLQLRGILQSGYTEFSIPWPGRDLDPEFNANPIPYMFSQVREGQLYPVFSPIFAILASVPYNWFGYTGLYVLPLLASLLALGGVARLVEVLVVEEGTTRTIAIHGAVLVAGLCTPLWFYSVVFWEHTLAASLCVWSVYHFACYSADDEKPVRSLLWSSLFAAVAVYLRDELYIFCALLVLCTAWHCRRRGLRQPVVAAAVMALALLPLWLFQWKALGHPLGFHLSRHMATEAGFVGHLLSRPKVVYNLLVSSSPSPALSGLVTIPFVVAAIRTWWPRTQASTSVVPALLTMATAGGIIALGGYPLTESPIQYMLSSSNALFAVAPVVILGLRHPLPGPSVQRQVLVIIFGYMALYCLAAPDIGSKGIHWGNRYFLFVYPLLVALAASTISIHVKRIGSGERWRRGSVALLVTILFSLCSQVYSIHLLDEKKALSRQMNEIVSARPEKVIVSTVRWAPQALFESFYDKISLYVESPRALKGLIPALKKAGHREVLLIAPGTTTQAMPKAQLVRDDELGFFSLNLITYEISTLR